MIESISKKRGVNHENLRVWVRRAETDAGERPGLTTDERVRMRQLEKENKELRRANEILKAASAFLGAELDEARAGTGEVFKERQQVPLTSYWKDAEVRGRLRSDTEAMIEKARSH